ncbi:Serine/threonine-protein kinase PrkC [Anaerohalosphaera lusitana]|uniref:Serine/threonine-protein kinase PrkC n=1 Tax=Anaerohalosphaera lusitana TaxID=1936003 RepID=A0A1U9NJI6_9BACT|nr:serine/threonine-protein kinase [Anaerohalosphaera lusitana]AQT67967.1 Serine/threonine-protein kinase PrkC [Anaerohalosphaera lusitana]
MPSSSVEIDGFTIIRKLGTGARSVIYLAKDDMTGNTIALKRAFLEKPEDTRIFEQIEKEYKVARQLDHPHIRKCYKLIKRRKLLRVNEVLLSMEMFEGKPLEDSPGLSLGDVILIFRMVATALNYMHQRGFVHCDIKPNNILIDGKGGLKVIDLGQSCKLGEIKQRIQGTPDYIAPEQVKRQHLSHRTDIFNLGATMYWALTGKNVPTLIPKNMDFATQVLQRREEFRAPHEIYRKIPRSLSQLVLDCVEEKPADRPESMSSIVSRLDKLIRDIFGNKLQKNGTASN